MDLSRIYSICQRQYGVRYQIDPTTLVEIMDQVQAKAVDEDLDAFLVTDSYITVLQEVTFDASGYTEAVAADVGLTVVGGASGSTGTLRYYNNTTRKWAVETSDDFTAGEAITITSGTGAGVLASSSHQAVYRGPYDFPDNFRKVMGITSLSDSQLFSSEPVYDSDLDYGFDVDSYDPRRKYQKARVNQLDRTATWVVDPVTTANTYRWWGWRRAPDITDVTDNTQLIIPKEAHLEYIEAVGMVGNSMKYGEETNESLFDRALFRLRQTMSAFSVAINNNADSFISEGQI